MTLEERMEAARAALYDGDKWHPVSDSEKHGESEHWRWYRKDLERIEGDCDNALTYTACHMYDFDVQKVRRAFWNGTLKAHRITRPKKGGGTVGHAVLECQGKYICNLGKVWRDSVFPDGRWSYDKRRGLAQIEAKIAGKTKVVLAVAVVGVVIAALLLS